MVSTSIERVPAHTAESINEQIRRRTAASVMYYAQRPEQIADRLDELDREWDVERLLETVSSSLTLLGLVGAITGHRKWLMLPLAVQGFFLQHAVQGWCPPLPVLRRLGFRTPAEIDAERYALKALRGDFDHVEGEDNLIRAEEALTAVMDGDGWMGQREWSVGRDDPRRRSGNSSPTNMGV